MIKDSRPISFNYSKDETKYRTRTIETPSIVETEYGKLQAPSPVKGQISRMVCSRYPQYNSDFARAVLVYSSHGTVPDNI